MFMFLEIVTAVRSTMFYIWQSSNSCIASIVLMSGDNSDGCAESIMSG